MTSATYVVLGIDKDKRPHAARFTEADAPAATKAASLMGFQIAKAEGTKALAAIKSLPERKLFASGRSLVPLVKAASVRSAASDDCARERKKRGKRAAG